MADDAGEGVDARLRALEERVASLEAELAARPTTRRLQPPPPPPAPVGPPPPPPTGAPVTGWRDSPPAPAAAPSPASEWANQLITEIVLKWAGLVLLFLAAVFLVSTAISRGWIGPELQLLGAVSLGAALVGFGLRPNLRTRGWGKSFAAVGVAVWFMACGAPSQWLDLGGVGKGMIGALVVAAVGLGLSRFVNSRLIAFTAFFGLTIVGLWVDAIDEYGADAFLVGALAAAVAFNGLHLERDWSELYIAVAVTTGLLGYAAAYEDESHTAVQLALVALALLYWFTPVARERLHSDSGDEVDQLAGRLQLATPSWLWGATMILHDFDSDGAGIVLAAVIAPVAAATAMTVRPFVRQWLWTSQLLGASVVLSIGLISWLDGSTLLGALAVQAVAMLVLSVAVDDTWFTWQSIITAGIVWLAALGLTLEAMEEDAEWGADIVHGLVFAATLGIGWYLRDRLEGRLLALVGYGGALLWIASVFVHFGQGQLIVSFIWAAIGVAVVVWGLSTGGVGGARVGLVTLAVTVAKLLTVDLAEVDTFWRAGLFFVIGLGLLWLSASIPKLVDGGDEPTDS